MALLPSAYSAQKICDHLIEQLGSGVTNALNRGIPGITDNQRSGDFIECVNEKGGWNAVCEPSGEHQREGGFDGATLILRAYPEAKVIHNANTALAVGSVEAQVAAGNAGDIFSADGGGHQA